VKAKEKIHGLGVKARIEERIAKNVTITARNKLLVRFLKVRKRNQNDNWKMISLISKMPNQPIFL